VLKNRSVIPAPGGPPAPGDLTESDPVGDGPVEPGGHEPEPGGHPPDDGPRAGDDPPDRDADPGKTRVEDAAADDADDASSEVEPDGVADPPTGDDPGPGPDADDPMGGAAPSG
jgi:hypothetical protein